MWLAGHPTEEQQPPAGTMDLEMIWVGGSQALCGAFA